MRNLLAVAVVLTAGVAAADPVPQLQVGFQIDGPVGQPVADYLFVTNTGDAPLVVSAIDFAIAPAGAATYALVDPLPITIAPGASQQLNTVFTPLVAGPATNTVTVTTNGGTASGVENLIGDNPVVLVADPTAFALDPMFADPAFPGAQTVTLNVSSPQPAPYFQFFLDGPSGASITTSPECTAASPCDVFPGDPPFPITISVATPSSAYETSTPIVIHTTDPSVAPLSVPFHVFVGYPHLTWDFPGGQLPPAIDVGAAPWGTPITATLTAHVDAPLPIFFDASFDGEAAYVSGPAGETSADPGDTLTWTYTCTPDPAGPTGMFTINSNEAGELHSAIVECEGIDAMPDGGVDAPPDAGDGGGGHHHGGCGHDPSDGCAAGGGGTGVPLVLALGFVVARRRRLSRPCAASRR